MGASPGFWCEETQLPQADVYPPSPSDLDPEECKARRLLHETYGISKILDRGPFHLPCPDESEEDRRYAAEALCVSRDVSRYAAAEGTPPAHSPPHLVLDQLRWTLLARRQEMANHPTGGDVQSFGPDAVQLLERMLSDQFVQGAEEIDPDRIPQLRLCAGSEQQRFENGMMLLEVLLVKRGYKMALRRKYGYNDTDWYGPAALQVLRDMLEDQDNMCYVLQDPQFLTLPEAA